jgi:drug/metabolite transporter (DMT)-like permease
MKGSGSHAHLHTVPDQPTEGLRVTAVAATVSASKPLARDAGSRNYWTGLLFVAASGVLASGNAVFVANRVQEIDPFLLLLITFGACTVIFTATVARHPGRLLAMVATSPRDVLLLNVFTAGTWIAFYAALAFLEPAVVTAIDVAVGPVIMLWLRGMAGRERAVALSEVVMAVGILASLGLLTWATLAGQSGIGAVRPVSLLIGLPASLLTGVCIVLTTLISKRLYNRGWTAPRVIAVRFWALEAMCAAVLLVTHRPVALPAGDVGSVLLIVTLGTVAPLYLLQLGVERLKPLPVALMLSAGPLFTLLFQAFDPRLRWSPFSIVGVTAATLLVAWSTIDGSRRTGGT